MLDHHFTHQIFFVVDESLLVVWQALEHSVLCWDDDPAIFERDTTIALARVIHLRSLVEG